MADPERLTHLDEAGHAHMVDVGAKPVTHRTATATARVQMSPATAAALAEGRLPKGDALPLARIAGISAAKRTADLLPLCHPVALSSVEVEVEVEPEAGLAHVKAVANAADRTGVEMEALVAVTTAALNLYDMVKALERGVTIERVELVEKTGGTRGDWRRNS